MRQEGPRYFFIGLFPDKANNGDKEGNPRLLVAKSLHQYRFPINTLFSLLPSFSSFSERMGNIPLPGLPDPRMCHMVGCPVGQHKALETALPPKFCNHPPKHSTKHQCTMHIGQEGAPYCSIHFCSSH